MMKNSLLQHGRGERGITLIEVLLYITLAGMMFLVLSTFLFVILQSRVKNQTITETDAQAAQVIVIIAQTIRNAQGINTPAAGASASSLSLDVVSAPLDPTVFDLSSGVLRIKEGAGSPVALTNSLVTASALSFQNASDSGTEGSVKFQFTLTHINPESRNEFQFQQTYYGTATLREQ